MDSDEDWDPSFFSAVDQLVEQHKYKQTQQPPQHQGGSQPVSPPPPAAAARQPAALPLQQPPAIPLQQFNGVGASGPGLGQALKPPLVVGRQQHPAPQPHGRPSSASFGQQAAGGIPPGRVSLAAAELRAQAAAAQPRPQQHWQGSAAAGAAPGLPADPQARLAQLQTELNRSEGQNKLLASNLQQKERELALLRQKVAQLGAGSSGGSGPGGGTGGVAGAAGAAQAQRSAFTVGELQRQLDSLRQQLMFKEQEMDDLKRQHSERTERLRIAEASIAELKGQMRQQAAAVATATAAGQQQAAPATAETGAVATAPQQQQQPHRPRSAAGHAPSTTAAPMQRGSGQKRRQSVGASGASTGGGGAGAGAAQAAAGATPSVPAGPLAEAGAGSSVPARAPLLDPAMQAAARSLGSSSSLVAALLAACSSSMALLVGAAPGPGAGAEAAGPAAAPVAEADLPPTALLLRSRLAAAAQAPDADSLQFVAAFSQRVQQVACGMLSPAALLDSIGALLAASLAQLNSCVAAGAGALPQQRVRLVAAGLHVAQHLVQLDRGCAAAALAAPGSSSSSSSWRPAPRLSSRVSLTVSSSGAAMASAAALSRHAWQPSSSSSSGNSSSMGLPGTAALVQQHASVFASLACGSSALLPVVLSAALSLGPSHEGVAAGALGTLVALARALQGEGARAVLAPVFTSGAMELFMRPPALRLQALRLLQLLLEEPQLAALFETSLSHAAAARGEPGPPTATAGNSGGDGSNGTPGEDTGVDAGQGPGGVANGGAQPMQIEGSRLGGEPGGGPWMGAAAITERLLDSFVLDEGGPLSADLCSSSIGGGGANQGGGRAAGAAATAAAAADTSLAFAGSASAARAAMQLVASLREARQHGILACLLLDDACGSPGCMLAQRLLDLAEAAMAPQGDGAAMMLLCPVQWPTGGGSSAGGSSNSSGGSGGGPSGGALLIQQQAVWQQRLRVAQEALTLLRGLLVDDSSGSAALDDLASIPSGARRTLTLLSRLSRLEVPPAAAAAGGGGRRGGRAGGAEDEHAAGAASQAGATAAAVAPAPPPALLAPWARAIGSSTAQPSVAEPASGAGPVGASLAPAGELPSCSVEDVVYMSRSMLARVKRHMARMHGAAPMVLQQG